MKKKIIGLLLIGITIILIVILIVCITNKESKDENTYICTKMDNTKKESKLIKHIVKLNSAEINNDSKEKDKTKEDDKKESKIFGSINTYITIINYEFNNKSDYEGKCYELKLKEINTNSSKDIDFKEKVTCNNKKKSITVKDVFVISKLSEPGRKSLESVLKYQKDDAFDLNEWLKHEKEDHFDCE